MPTRSTAPAIPARIAGRRETAAPASGARAPSPTSECTIVKATLDASAAYVGTPRLKATSGTILSARIGTERKNQPM